MRTNNKMLRKTIAFVSSLTMLASSIPAFSIAASATPVTGVTVAATYPTNSKKTFDGTTDGGKAVDGQVDTFDAFIKIGGKYLVKETGTATPAYKLVSSAPAGTDYELVSAFSGVAMTESTENGKYIAERTDSNGNKTYTPTTITGTAPYDELKAAGNVIQLPYFAEANPTVTLEFVPKNKASFNAKSLTSIDVTLDDNGMAQIPADTKTIISRSDTTTYDEETKYFKDDVAEVETQSYEIVDISGMKIQMAPAVSTESMPSLEIATNKSTPNTASDGIKAPTGNADFGTEESTLTPASYMLKKVGNVYATVLTGTLAGSAMADIQKPGDKIIVDPGFYTTAWSVSGTGWNSSTKKLELTMGSNGWAESGLITAEKGSDKEYYVFAVKNYEDATVKGLEDAVKASGKFAGEELTSSTVHDVLSSNAKFRVEEKTTTVSFNDTSLPSTQNAEKFVKVYTIYNNESDDTYNDSTDKTITIDATGTNTFALPSARLYEAGDETANATNGAKYDVAAVRLTDGDTTLTAAAKTAADASSIGKAVTAGTVTLTKTGPGTAKSAILKVADAAGTNYSYVQYVFTNKYEIKYNDHNANTNKGKTYDGKVAVEGTTVTKPADAEKPGYEFLGWYLDNDTFTGSLEDEVYTVAGGDTQITTATDKITPNATLGAKYDGQMYNIKLHAGGGYLNVVDAAIAKSGFKMYDGTSLPTIGTYTNIAKTANDLTAYLDEAADVKAVRVGYDFKGWALTEDATEALDLEEFDEAFPGEGKTLELYPVFEAKKNLSISWGSIRVNPSTGIEYNTDGKLAAVDDAGAGDDTKDIWLDGTAPTMTTAQKSKTVTVGEKLGELPVPTKKGYVFDGWFAKTINPLTKVVTAQKVTADTVVDETILDRADDADDAAGTLIPVPTKIELYARFTQKQYNITFDLGDGAWQVADYDKDTSDKPVSYKFFDNKLKVFNAKGGVVFSDVVGAPQATKFTATNDPKVGGGDIKTFDGWTIGNSTTKVTSANLLKSIENLTSPEDLTIKANYKNADNYKTNFNITVNANGGKVYYATLDATTGEPSEFYDTADRNGSIDVNNLTTSFTLKNLGTVAGAPVASEWTVEDNKFTSVGTKTNGVVLARAGYTFTGWYADKDCTTPYTFGNFPAAGSEDVVYAGWKANANTRYRLNYDLYSKDGSLVSTDDNGTKLGSKKNYTFNRTRTGETGSIADASKIELVVRQGSGTNATETTYVYDSKLSDAADATAEIEATFDTTELSSGNFVESSDKYVNIYGRYVVKGTEHKELGTVSAASITVAEDGTVKWTAADNAVKYKVIKIGSNGKAYAGAETDKTTFKFAAVPTSDYEVQVVAFDAEGNKTTSEKVKVTVKSTGTLGTVDAKTITVGTDRKTVTWTAIEGATSYRVIKTVNGKAYASAAVTEPTYTFANVTYSAFSVKVVAMKGTEKTYSDAVNVAVAESADHGKVVNPKVTKDGKVTWTAVPDAVSYRVAKFINDKAYYGTAVEAPTTEYTFAKVPTDDYKVYVVSYFADGSKTYGTITKVSTKLDAPTNVQISADKKTVTFDAVEGAVKYQIKKTTIAGKAYYGSKFEGTSVTMGSAATKGMTIQVLAFDAEGNSSLSDGIVVE